MLAPEPVPFAVGPAGTACSGFLWLFGLRAGCNGRSCPPVDLAGRGVRTSQGLGLSFHEPAPAGLAPSIGYSECVRFVYTREGDQGWGT